MAFVLAVLWTVPLVLLVVGQRGAATRWLAVVLFCGGCGALSALIGDVWLPDATAAGASSGTLKLLDQLRIGTSLMQYYGLPYAYILFGLAYNGVWLTLRRRLLCAMVLLVPIAVTMAAVTPIHPIPYNVVVWWAMLYIAAGTVLVALRRESSKRLRRNHVLSALAVCPAIVFASIMNYVLPSLGFVEMWRYNTWAIGMAFAIFLIAIFGYGFLGVQFLVTRRQLDVSIRAATSGTALLNHAIKNDVGKIKLFAERIARAAEKSGQTELAQDAAVIASATEHVRELVARVKERTQELPLRPERADLAVLVREAARRMEPSLGDRIRMRLELPESLPMTLDRARVAEALQNLLDNAVEAMPAGGDLTVRLMRQRRRTLLEVRDTGGGMEAEALKRALEPFYTTKGGSRLNFGLGLSYSYQVMKEHRGDLWIESKPGTGTTVTMAFPG